LKIALAVWGDRISPVFDSARTVLIAELKNGKVIDRRYESLGPELPYTRALKLSGWGIQVLICGAISIEFARTIEVYGIKVIPFITGQAQQVLDVYVDGVSFEGSFHMPGFRKGRRTRFRGGHR
jgi:predicted Fe-Mo cluster-binding NifX family protein